MRAFALLVIATSVVVVTLQGGEPDGVTPTGSTPPDSGVSVAASPVLDEPEDSAGVYRIDLPTTTSTPDVAATTTTTLPPPTIPADAPWYQQRGLDALALIEYPWQATGYEINFRPGVRGYQGITYLKSNRIDIFVRESQTTSDLARVIAHELGHAVDLAWMTDDERSQYLDIRGIGSIRWFGCGNCSDYATGAGDFAETFAWWLLGPGDYRSELAGPPDHVQLQALEGFFAARLAGVPAP